MKPIHSDHRRVEERSLAMHKLLAEKVRADPNLLDQARENLRCWQRSNGSPSLTLAEWENILRGSAAQVASFLEERSEKAVRLRQSSPFAGILSQRERETIYESYATRTYHSSRQPDIG